jgi:hypothetical protein
LVETIHIHFSHASVGELKRISGLNFNELEEITISNIDHWYQECGKFYSGCAKGKMKEHARIKFSCL